MGQSSIIIHKGGKEDKYEIYVEDYVLSFLKEETGTLELSEFYFYGFKEKYGRKYTIYGAGRDKYLHVFDKYSLLEEIGCRLTQAGPVFLVREGTDTYEVKGYEVFYQDNQEMQNYLIDRKRGNGGQERKREPDTPPSGHNTPFGSISVQLGVILIVLVAIVINSANSYDEMQQLNRSASEVFFAMENQEADHTGGTDSGRSEIVVEREESQGEDVLKLAALENAQQADGMEEADGGEAPEEAEGETQQQETDENAEEPQSSSESDEETAQEADGEDSSQTDENASDTETEEVEALSRNVARYYKVERGDTLYTISRKIYGDTTHVQKICELNQIDDPDRIRYGQKIILP